MFMVSFRLKAGRILAAAALAAAAILGTALVRSAWGGDAVSVSNNEAKGTSKAKKVKVKTNEQRLDFIRSFGWEVMEDAAEVMEVIIPKEFDSVYEDYNSLQKRQGYDLAPHAGKRCKRYTYVVTNYPGQPESVRISLLVRDNKIIGGDVCSLLPDGFMHGFEPPEQAPEDALKKELPTKKVSAGAPRGRLILSY